MTRIEQEPVKTIIVHNPDGSRTKKVYYDGRLVQECIFKDVDGDGKEDIYSVTNYYKGDNGSFTSKTFIDNDGDGYDDEVIEKFYDDEFKNLKQEIRTIEENINSVRNRQHMDYEEYNRSMAAHDSGYYML